MIKHLSENTQILVDQVGNFKKKTENKNVLKHTVGIVPF